MFNKLSIPVVLSVLALVVSGFAYLSPAQVAKSGEAACPALQEAYDKLTAKNPLHPGLVGLDKAIANNCQDIGNVNCGQDFGLDGFTSSCFTDTESCVAAGVPLCLEPSSTCSTASGGTKTVCGVSL